MTNSVLAKLAVVISANTAEFTRSINSTQTTLQNFAGNINKLSGQLGLAFGATAVFSGIKYGIDLIRDFDHRMSEVRAITQATDSEFKQLRDSALLLGKSTKFTAEEVAGLQVEFGKLGFSTREILASTKATIELATATGEDLSKSADIAGATLRAFNLDASEMQRVVDVMAASFNKSALGLENFGEAIKYVAPVAAAANISLEETTAMLGVLADAGIRGSMAGTSLRKIISDVGGESGTLSERLQKLAEKGITGADAMDEVGRTAYASLLILTKHIDKVNEATDAYSNASGEAKKMADIMSDDLTGDIQKMNSAFESAIINGDQITGSLRGLVQSITELINIMSSSGFVKAVIGGLDNLVKMGMFIPQLVKYIREYNKANKEVAITAEENQAIIEEVWGKPDDIQKTNSALDTHAQKIDKVAKSLSTISQLRNLKMSGSWDKFDPTTPDFSQPEGPDINLPMTEDEMHNQTSALLGLTDAWSGYGDMVVETTDKVAKKMIDIGPIIANAITGIAEAIGKAAAGSSDFGKDLIKAVAGFAQQLGALFIATGVAEAAFQSGNPYAMVAAGAALVALGAAVGELMSKQSQGSRAMASGGGSSSGGPGQLPSEAYVRVDGKISGYNLELVSQKESYRRGRVG